MSSRTLYAQHPITKDISISPRFSPTIFSPRLYGQNPVFEIVREESVRVYVHMYNGNVQQNYLFNIHL